MKRLYGDYKPLWHCASYSGKLKNIKKTLKQYLKGYTYETDNIGNIFIGNFEKNRPCLVAHIDSVFKKAPQKISLNKGILRSKTGLGADDKCGIITILEVLKINSNINAILTIDEEIGGIGARNIKVDKLKNVQYFIEVDRQGKSDIVNNIYGENIASYEFIEDIENLISKFNFKLSNGAYTDILDLSEKSRISAINLSAGYYNPHTKDEYVILKELQNTINFVKAILKSTNKKYELQELSYIDDINFSYALEDITDLKALVDLSQYCAYSDIELMLFKAYDLGFKKPINRY